MYSARSISGLKTVPPTYGTFVKLSIELKLIYSIFKNDHSQFKPPQFSIAKIHLDIFILFEAVWVAMELYLILPAFLLLTTLSSSITAWRPLVRSQERALPEDILHEMTLNVVRHLIILTLLF